MGKHVAHVDATRLQPLVVELLDIRGASLDAKAERGLRFGCLETAVHQTIQPQLTPPTHPSTDAHARHAGKSGHHGQSQRAAQLGCLQLVLQLVRVRGFVPVGCLLLFAPFFFKGEEAPR